MASGFDRYQKVQKLGQGSYGKAWLVKSSLSGRLYVLKDIIVVAKRDEAKLLKVCFANFCVRISVNKWTFSPGN